MKVLIVDDNVAIQEIIADILVIDGKEVQKASTVAEAVDKYESFKPDAIILDSKVGDENGLDVLDALNPNYGERVIILTKSKDVLPKDTSFIYGFVQKPFKSDEILSKVRALEADIDPKHVKEKSKFKLKLFSKRANKDDSGEELLGVRFGKSFVVFENEPEGVYKLAGYFLSKEYDVLIMTSGKIKSITERYKESENLKVIGLSSKVRMGYIEMSRVGTIVDQVKKFIAEHDKPVIVFDDLQGLIEINGLNTVVTLVYQVIHDANKTSSLIVSIDEDILTDKDKDLFLHNMERFDPQDTEE